MKKSSRKYSRLNEEIKRALSDIIRNDLKDPGIGLVTSVTCVEATTDLKECKVYISVLGDEAKRDETMAALERAKGFMRHMLAEKLNLRNTPELFMLADRTIEHGMHIDSILDELNERNEISRDPEEADEG